jgi:hypothetical protein
MINTLIKHQNDIKIGKVVSQIIHDLKSPLSVFEEIINNKNYIQNDVNYRKSNQALLKIYSLIESIRDPRKENNLNIQKNTFDFSRLLNEISYYAKTKSAKIKIISEKKAKQLKPDYFFVLPWHFRNFILNKEKKIIRSGIKFIFPLPKFQVI